MEIKSEEYEAMQRKIAKLDALESGGVDNWDGYDSSICDWRAENEVEEALDLMIEYINDTLVEAKIDEPAGTGAGYSIEFNERHVKDELINFAKKYKEIQDEKE